MKYRKRKWKRIILVCIVVCSIVMRYMNDVTQYAVDLSELHSGYAVLVDADTGEVIGKKNGNKRMYPASLTKMMTAIVAIEHTADFEYELTLSSDLFARLYLENASLAGFEPEEKVILRDLLYGMLLPSGAECCIAYAEYIADSEKAFVELMNDKAEMLGMKSTHFTNTTGLHDDEHYSTAEDMALLVRYALENEMFREVFTSHRYTVQSTNKHTEGFTMFSTMFKNIENTFVTDGEILGGKTGYTQKAGLCLASLARINGKEYILVTAKAEGNHYTTQYHIEDALWVYEEVGVFNQTHAPLHIE